MKSIFKGLILVCLIASSPAEAVSPSCYLKVLRMITSGVQYDGLNETELATIDDWFKDEATRETAPAKVFDLLLSKRLENLSPEIQEQVAKVLKDSDLKKILRSPRGGKFGAQFVYYNQIVKIQIPSSLRESALYYMTLTHEIEHAVQYNLYLKEYESVLARKMWIQREYQFMRKRTFLLEKGAITAEWSYLRSIPRLEQEKMLDEVLRHPDLDFRSKEIVRGFFENSNLPLEKYIKIQQANRNYSKWKILKNSIPDIIIGESIRLPKRVFYSTISLYATCAVLAGIKKFDPVPSFYHQICKRLFFNYGD
jgi:hypothetical protein